MLREGCELPISAQANMVLAICILHNVICTFDPQDNDDTLLDDERVAADGGGSEGVQARGISRAESAWATALRDSIAQAMWSDHEEQRSQRGGRHV
jgi:hypothetical protein